MSDSNWPRFYLCDCDPRFVNHRHDCPASPILGYVMLDTMFNPWLDPPMDQRFWETWFCVTHGKLGDINGPVHFQTCPRESRTM